MSLTIAAMPAYNEERSIARVVLGCKRYVDQVVVVDDGSCDSTAEIAESVGAYALRHGRRIPTVTLDPGVQKNAHARLDTHENENRLCAAFVNFVSLWWKVVGLVTKQTTYYYQPQRHKAHKERTKELSGLVGRPRGEDQDERKAERLQTILKSLCASVSLWWKVVSLVIKHNFAVNLVLSSSNRTNEIQPQRTQRTHKERLDHIASNFITNLIIRMNPGEGIS